MTAVWIRVGAGGTEISAAERSRKDNILVALQFKYSYHVWSSSEPTRLEDLGRHGNSCWSKVDLFKLSITTWKANSILKWNLHIMFKLSVLYFVTCYVIEITVIILKYKYEMWTHLPLKCCLRMIKAVRKYPQNDILLVLDSKYYRFFTPFRVSKILEICVLRLKVVREMHKITTSWTSLPIHLHKLPQHALKTPTNMFHMFKKTTSFHHIRRRKAERHSHEWP